MFQARTIFKIALIIGIALSYVLIVSKIFPFTMDEFLVYHPLACLLYPLNELNSFRMGCASFDLAPLSAIFTTPLFLPLRSYSYVGSISGLLYFPFYLIWPSPYSARFLGILMLAIQALCIQKLYRVHVIKAFLILLCYFPYAVQHLIDTGQLSFQTTSIFLYPLLVHSWIRSLLQGKRSAFLYPALIGLLLFFCTWIKISYLFLLPAIGLTITFELYSAYRDNKLSGKYRLIALGFFILLACCLVPSAVLFTAVDLYGTPYYEVITSSVSKEAFDLFRFYEHFKNDILRYIIDPSTAAHIVLISPDSIPNASIVVNLSLLFVLIYGVWSQRHHRFSLLRAASLLIGFIITLVLVVLSKDSRHMQHVMIAYPFILLLIFSNLNFTIANKLLIIPGVLWILSNIYLYNYNLESKHRPTEMSPTVPVLNQTLNQRFEKNYVFAIVDWGFYFTKALYGPANQCVLWPQERDEYRLTKSIANSLNRKVVFVGWSPLIQRRPELAQEFPDLQKLDLNFNSDGWEVWYEPS